MWRSMRLADIGMPWNAFLSWDGLCIETEVALRPVEKRPRKSTNGRSKSRIGNACLDMRQRVTYCLAKDWGHTGLHTLPGNEE